jgi:hypothetical protein
VDLRPWAAAAAEPCGTPTFFFFSRLPAREHGSVRDRKKRFRRDVDGKKFFRFQPHSVISRAHRPIVSPHSVTTTATTTTATTKRAKYSRWHRKRPRRHCRHQSRRAAAAAAASEAALREAAENLDLGIRRHRRPMAEANP